MDSTPPPEAVTQNGVFTTQQAVEAGTSHYRIRRLLDRGLWVVVVGTVLAQAGTAMTATSLARAGLLAVRTGGVISHLTAALLHGLKVPADNSIHLIVGRDRRVRIENVRTHRVPLEDSEIELVDGMLRTTLARTLLDCLLWLSEESGRAMLVDALQRRVVTVDAVRRAIEASGLRHGMGRAWTVLGDVARDAHSEGEVVLHRLLRAAHVTGWKANAGVYDAAGLIGVVDILFEQARLIVEIDGAAFHSGPVEFQRDRSRQNRLVAAGYRVLRFTWHDLTQEPERVMAEIQALVAAAA